MKRNVIRPLHPRKLGRRFRLHQTCRPFLERLESRLAPANVDVLSFHNDLFLDA